MQENTTQPAQTDSESTPNRAQSEIQEFITTMQQRRRVFPRAALVGAGAGVIAALFRASLAYVEHARNDLVAWAHQFPYLGWIFPILFAATGAVVSVILVRRLAPEASGSGIPHLEGVLHRLRTLEWKRVLPVKFLSGTAAIGTGLTLGREGPTVQMGGAVGDAVAEWLRVGPEERRTLIAAGAGAGLAAAFNAPLAGVMFVVEEIRRDFHPIIFGAAFLAAAVADIMVRLILGPSPDFSIPSYPTPPVLSLPAFVVLGTLAGFVGVLFNRTLLGTLDLFARVKGRWVIALVAGIGACAGLAGWFSPVAMGSGHALAEVALAGNIALAAIPILFVVRFFLATSSYGTGAAGGVFAPLLALGALLGLGIGQVARTIDPAAVPQPAVLAVVGMAAFFTAIVRAPLTGIVLIVEMTGNYQQILPLLVSCFCAYAVSEVLRDLPLYEALLERDLKQVEAPQKLREPLVMDFEIERGAPLAGRQVRSLGLPSGCVLVRGVDAGREFVPSAFTRLEPHMRITAVIAPEAAEAIQILREGCKSADRRRPPEHDI